MLVLSRRIDERIMIGDQIVITVLEIHHDHIRLGIEAPREIHVHREEVFEAIQAANLAAADSGAEQLGQLKVLAGNRLGQPTEKGEPGEPSGGTAEPAAPEPGDKKA